MKKESKTAGLVGRGGLENHHVAVKEYRKSKRKTTELSTRMDVTVLAFKPARPGSILIGSVGVRWPRARLRIHNCPMFQRGDSRWAMPPSIDGKTVNLGANGRPLYSPVLTFDAPDLHTAFSDAVIAALLGYRPHAFKPSSKGGES